MKKYNCLSPMGFKFEKNNQREAYAEIPLLKICKISTVFLAAILFVHYIMVCIVTQLYAYGAEHLSPGKNSNYINTPNMAPFICHCSPGLNLRVACVLSLQQLPSSGKANQQRVTLDSAVNAKHTEIYLSSMSLISFV